MTVIIDYGVGNLFSISRSLSAVGEEALISGDRETVLGADRIILPGVGAFRDAIAALKETGADKTIYEANSRGIPIMGICLGMQLLFDVSYENGKYKGLGLIPGEVVPIDPTDKNLLVPHVGYNKLIYKTKSKLFTDAEERYMYFVHSYYANTEDKYITSYVEYGNDITASVENGLLFGCQFHPEKSGEAGLGLLKKFCDTERRQ